MSDRDSGTGFVWFLAGLGLGALAGVLYAPRSGSETRERTPPLKWSNPLRERSLQGIWWRFSFGGSLDRSF